MRILISGSNGIIGQQILKELITTYPDADFYVVNRSPSLIIGHKKITSFEVDILAVQESVIEELFSKIKAELFFHLAWDTSHSNYLDTLDNYKWEYRTILMIDLFYIFGGKRFIGIGSSIEYDWNYPPPYNENTSIVSGSKFLYGQAKLNAAKYLKNKEEISYIWCRIFFVFGPGQGRTRLVPLIINNALTNGPGLELNLKLMRDYLSTFEIAKQVVMMQQTDYIGPVNICSGKQIMIGDIVESISSILQKRVNVSTKIYQDKFEIESIYGTIDLMKYYYSNYEYSNQCFFKDLEKTIDYYKTI
jgi:dTDP-6-deoxy-L-talose 4-dehydrogenase (NAD+)